MRILLSTLLALSLLGCGDDDGSTGTTDPDMAMGIDGGSDGGGGGGGSDEFTRACEAFYIAAIPCDVTGLITEEFAVMTCAALDNAIGLARESEACRAALVDVIECATITSCEDSPECTDEEIAVENACEVIEPPSA